MVGGVKMLKRITVDLETIESFIYFWTCVNEREKVAESYLLDIANAKSYQDLSTDNFTDESIRKVLSAIQNSELLSQATKEEKRFWSCNMWMIEDPDIMTNMVSPIKQKNFDHLVEEIQRERPDFPFEEIIISILPLHLEDKVIKSNHIYLNFFKINTKDNSIRFLDQPFDAYVKNTILELKD